MKHKLLPLILLLFLVSCSITKRKYLPGYAVNWGHKVPKTMVCTKPNVERKLISQSNLKSIAAKNTREDIIYDVPASLLPQLAGTRHVVSLPSMSVTYAGKSYIMLPHQQTQWNGLKNNLTEVTSVDQGNNKKVVCRQANTSLTLGIIAWVAFLSIAICTLLIGLSSLSSGNLMGLVIIILGVYVAWLAGIVLGILAEIYGSSALSKIKKNPDTYRGKGNAILLNCKSLLPNKFLTLNLY